jgi:hypothetical protein
MSFFGVTKEKIKTISPIKDADRIELASLEGMDFQFVIGKGQFTIGEECLYFPVDSLLPAPLIEKLGLTGKLAGKEMNRIKTVKLRGQISQGIVSKTDLIPNDLKPEEITNYLGVTKYEPPEIICDNAKLLPLPDGLSAYDIESADRHVDVAQLLMDQEVVITEKLEGTNFSTFANSGEIMVNQHNKTIIPIGGDEHTFWKVAKRCRLTEFALQLNKKYGKPAAVYGEMIGPGIQDNIYKLKEHEVRMFDIKVNFNWLPFEEFKKEVTEFYGAENMPEEHVVPILYVGKLREFLNGSSIKVMSDGQSRLAAVNREGFVIKHPTLERLILKQRSPAYLAKSKL